MFHHNFKRYFKRLHTNRVEILLVFIKIYLLKKLLPSKVIFNTIEDKPYSLNLLNF